MTDPATIERLAREAGCFTPGCSRNYWAVTDHALARFSELIAAHALGRLDNPTDEMLRAMLAVKWPAIFRHGLSLPGDGPTLQAENAERVEVARKQLGAVAAAIRALKEKE